MTAPRLEPLPHGGDIDAARARYPDAPEPWVDLSTGINPHAYPVPEVTSGAWRQLPQSFAERDLLLAARRRYGVPADVNIVAAPGSQALIQIVPRLIDASEVAIVGPTYGEHAASWQRCGHRVQEVASIAKTGAARVVIVVNPDNPTGRIFSVEELSALADNLAARDGLLVVDEAFADFVPSDAGLASRLPASAVLLRSFGKAYGLAGVRLGFAIAHERWCSQLRAEVGPWAVAGPAMEIGTAALRDDAWLAAMAETLAADCRRLDQLLQDAGLAVVGGTQLFRLAECARAPALADALGRAGILVRSFPYNRNWLRFGLPGGAQQWQRLEAVLRDFNRNA
ncbi:L-threonine 3-O-phosphate decarboxylase [Hyphomicrobium sulfonivorans]|uniref:threonine-phosphate decarboxylase n=1 Tax=Hyphomicrobium sulfonivorans TaxID=121290 RepID=A0A120CTV6_HYPSL|nr:threonine-phosphate decarboxylase CobD [Hyphomicrobium sulfonivorans]KWT65245.1 L-threonine 3-O-phosphate decarboxylase [Hyphomicrobium sulfonivorans]